MRARVLEGHGRLLGAGRKFRPGRWYDAQWVEGEPDAVRLMHRSRSAIWPRQQVEIRSAGDDEWEVRSASRIAESRDGQRIDFPARVAECPQGHVRTIPSRFDSPVVALRCAECGTAYRLG